MFKDCKTLLELKINNGLEYIEDDENFDINNIELENNENNINCWEDEETNLNKSLEFYGDNGIDEDNNTYIIVKITKIDIVTIKLTSITVFIDKIIYEVIEPSKLPA